jgi:cysteinyl-tRNA synthetase
MVSIFPQSIFCAMLSHAKIDKRNQARNNKNFDLSDQIRDELAELGIINLVK